MMTNPRIIAEQLLVTCDWCHPCASCRCIQTDAAQYIKQLESALKKADAPMFRFWLCKQFYRSKGDVPKWYIRPFAAQVPPSVGMDVCIGGMDDPRKIESICVNENGAVVCELPADVWNVGDSPSDDVSERDWPRQREHELRGWQEWSDFSTLGPA